MCNWSSAGPKRGCQVQQNQYCIRHKLLLDNIYSRRRTRRERASWDLHIVRGELPPRWRGARQASHCRQPLRLCGPWHWRRWIVGLNRWTEEVICQWTDYGNCECFNSWRSIFARRTGRPSSRIRLCSVPDKLNGRLCHKCAQVMLRLKGQMTEQSYPYRISQFRSGGSWFQPQDFVGFLIRSTILHRDWDYRRGASRRWAQVDYQPIEGQSAEASMSLKSKGSGVLIGL